jgi:hypothetical protein
MEIKEIEHKIACNELNAAQVFTQMLQHTNKHLLEDVRYILEKLEYAYGITGESPEMLKSINNLIVSIDKAVA